LTYSEQSSSLTASRRQRRIKEPGEAVAELNKSVGKAQAPSIGLLTRHRRAVLFHSRLPAFWQSVLLASIPTIAIALWLSIEGVDKPVETVLIPAAIAIISFIAILVVTWGYEYLRLLISGRAPPGSKRTLKHVNIKKVRQVLTVDVPSGTCSITLGVNTKEIQDFADELQTLLSDCGWQMGGQGFYIGGENRDIDFNLPENGSQGLEGLSDLLNRIGYKSTLVNEGGSSPSIDIGEATH
jgi:hypothetical protein